MTFPIKYRSMVTAKRMASKFANLLNKSICVVRYNDDDFYTVLELTKYEDSLENVTKEEGIDLLDDFMFEARPTKKGK